MLAPVSEPNERAVYQSMLEGCQAALDGCASTPVTACAGRRDMWRTSTCSIHGMSTKSTYPCVTPHACAGDRIGNTLPCCFISCTCARQKVGCNQCPVQSGNFCGKLLSRAAALFAEVVERLTLSEGLCGAAGMRPAQRRTEHCSAECRLAAASTRQSWCACGILAAFVPPFTVLNSPP